MGNVIERSPTVRMPKRWRASARLGPTPLRNLTGEPSCKLQSETRRCAKLRDRRGSSSSSVSPVPRNRIGTCTARRRATTLPPLAVAVQLGDHESRERHRRGERLRLANRVLSYRGIEHEQRLHAVRLFFSFPRRARSSSAPRANAHRCGADRPYRRARYRCPASWPPRPHRTRPRQDHPAAMRLRTARRGGRPRP